MDSNHPRENTDAAESLTGQKAPTAAFADKAHERESVQGNFVHAVDCGCAGCLADAIADRTCICGALDCDMGCSEENDTRSWTETCGDRSERGYR